MTSVFAHGELRLYLLALLTGGPKHGYELMTDLAARFGGTYRPSAGTIYPRLARLEEEGLVSRHSAGRKSTYELTPAGRAEVAARQGDLDALESGIAETVRQRAEALRADAVGTMRSMRAELTAAVQATRTTRRPAQAQAPARGPRATSSGMEAEALLHRFVEEVSAELAEAEAAGRLDTFTVDALRAVLDGSRAAMHSIVIRTRPTR